MICSFEQIQGCPYRIFRGLKYHHIKMACNIEQDYNYSLDIEIVTICSVLNTVGWLCAEPRKSVDISLLALSIKVSDECTTKSIKV